MRWVRIEHVALAILVVQTVLLGYESWQHSPVMQEPAQLVAGITEWQVGRFDIYDVNPPLVRLVAALPVLLQSPNFVTGNYHHSTALGRQERQMGSDFLEENKRNVRQFFFFSRVFCIPFGLVGAFFSWRWAAAMYGKCAGLIAMALWSFCPYFLGHGATIMPDVPSAALGLISMYYYWKWVKNPKWSSAIVAGIVLGLAELCKFTLLILYPLIPLLWLICRQAGHKLAPRTKWFQEAAALVASLLISVYIINFGYFFEHAFKRLDTFRFHSCLFTACRSLEDVPIQGGNRFIGSLFGKWPVLIPASMVDGIDTQQLDFERGLPSYLRGEWETHGWWYYYLYALALKLPLGTWGLIFSALALTFYSRRHRASWTDEIFLLVPMLSILILVSSKTGFSVHSRYVIPALPFLFVWTSKVALVFDLPYSRQKTTAVTLIVAAFCWSIASCLTVYPHSLAYFNELALLPTPYDDSYPNPDLLTSDRNGTFASIAHFLTAGPRNGPRHLLDSNMDCGQDLYGLENWCKSHLEARPILIACRGHLSMDQNIIEAVGSPPRGPDLASSQPLTGRTGPLPGWYALSVEEIYGRSHWYRYFLNFRPVENIGFSIYIYHITLEQANRVRKVYHLPELLDDDGT